MSVTFAKRLARAAALPSLALLAACATAPDPVEELPPALPVMAWDHVPGGEDWTEATLDALQRDGTELLSLVPGDIEAWCPGYVDATPEERAAFWAGLLSALARYESRWTPDAVGGGGRWFGLVQIDPRTAQGHGCEARTGRALQDGVANLACAVRIAANQVTRRGTVSRGMRDWGPFHSATHRAEMRDWVSQQEYCRAPAAE